MARPAKKASSKPAASKASKAAAKAKPAASKKTVAAKTPAKVPSKAPAKTAVKAPPKAPPKSAASKPAAAAAAKPAATKPAVPEAPPAPKVRKPPPMSEKDAAAIRAELNEQRATLAKELEDLDLGSLTIAQSELSGEVSFDEEYADAGTFTFERERDLSLSNNIRDLMDKVDSALARLDDGTYGSCERCGNPIDKARLKALPYSVLCISCKKQEERIR